MSSEGKDLLILPNVYAVHTHGRRHTAKRVATRTITKSRRNGPLPRRHSQDQDVSVISSLPTELLVNILEHIIPTGGIFHFGPKSCTTGGVLYVSVHQFRRSGNWKPRSDFTSLALACKRLRDVSYGLWYGRNQFAVELATTSLTSEVQLGVDAPTKIDIEGGGHLLSCCRLCSRGPIFTPYPSAPFTLRYISDLTICINLSSCNSSRDERRELSQQLQSIVTCFGDDASNLRRLAVSLDVCERRHKLPKSQRLELCDNSPRMMLRKTISINHVNITARQFALLQQLMEPLSELRGVGDVVDLGLLGEESATVMRQSVTRPPGTCETQKELPSKRVREAV